MKEKKEERRKRLRDTNCKIADNDESVARVIVITIKTE